MRLCKKHSREVFIKHSHHLGRIWMRLWFGLAALSGSFAATPAVNAQPPVITTPADLLYLDINEVFDPAANNTWTPRAAMPTPREAFAIAEAGGIIFVAGGEVFNNCAPINTFEAYNPANNTWTTLPPMPAPRWRMAAVTVNGKIFVVGGQTGCVGAVNTVMAFDLGGGVWIPGLTGMPAGPRANLGIAVLHDNNLNRDILYAVGGSGPDPQNSPVATVEAYDAQTNTWIPRQSLNTARRGPAVVSVGGKIYAIGGETLDGMPLNTIEEYNPANNTWTTKPSVIPTPRILGPGVAVLNGKVLVCGGRLPGQSVTSTVSVYDPFNDMWTTAPAMPTARDSLGAAVVNNKLYAIGGFLSEGAATAGQPFVLQITATNHPTSYGASGLPSGLSLDSSSGIISGIPTAPTDTQITLSAANSSGPGSKSVRFTVQNSSAFLRPMIISTRCVTGRTGQPFRFQVLTRNASLSAQLAASGLPPGLTFNPATGVISGTPASNGSFEVALSVTDGDLTTRSGVQLTFISNPTGPIIISRSNALLIPGQFFSYTITADATATFKYVGTDGVINGALPQGLTFNPQTATISGVYSGGPQADSVSKGVTGRNRPSLPVALRAATDQRPPPLPRPIKIEPPANIIAPIGEGDGTGVGALNFFPPLTFPLWEQLYFTQPELNDPLITDDFADPDRDGFSNLLEYGLNLDPKTTSTADLPLTTIDPTYLSLTYTKMLVASDLTYAIEESTDLILWSVAAPVNQILTDDGYTQTVKAQVPRSDAGTAGKLFLRLKVSR